MNRDDDQELWDLLGKRIAPSLSPFFARNVVREVRQSRNSRALILSWLSRRRFVPAAAVALAVCAALVTLRLERRPVSHPSDDNIPDVVAQIDPSDYEIVADLDDLLAAQEDDSWDDTPTL